MEQRSTGLILRTRPLTETSLIVHWLTADLGRIATVAKGARRNKSPFSGKLDLFYLADFSLARSRRSELHTLREVSVREYHANLRQSLGRLQQGCYFAELIEQTTETETPLPEVFKLLVQALTELAEQSVNARTVFAFELKTLAQLGLQPDLAQASLTLGAREFARQLQDADWPFIARLALAKEQVRELDQFLYRYLVEHVGRVAKTRAAAVHAAV